MLDAAAACDDGAGDGGAGSACAGLAISCVPAITTVPVATPSQRRLMGLMGSQTTFRRQASAGSRHRARSSHTLGGQPGAEVVIVAGQALGDGHCAPHGRLGGGAAHQAVAVRLEEFIDVDEVGALAGADHQVEVVVLSPPDLRWL